MDTKEDFILFCCFPNDKRRYCSIEFQIHTNSYSTLYHLTRTMNRCKTNRSFLRNRSRPAKHAKSHAAGLKLYMGLRRWGHKNKVLYEP